MPTIEETLQTALNLHRSGNLHLAETTYGEILRVDSSHSEASHLLGVAVFQRGRADEALPHIRRSIELNPGRAEFHNSLAIVLRTTGELAAAEEACRKALAINPNFAEAHNTLGNVLRELNHLDEARAAYRRALACNPLCKSASASLQALKAEAAAGHSANSKPVPPATRLKTVLHVGCGPKNPALLHNRFRGPEWKELRLDIDPAVKPDIVASLTDMHPVEDHSVDALWSSHNLEHLHAHEVPAALAEFHRVLKPGGQVLICVPDLKQVAEFIVADKLEDVAYESPAGPIRPLDCLYGLAAAVEKGNEYMAHHTGFTAKTLTGHLQRAGEVGFGEINTWQTPFNLWAEARKR